MDYRANKDFSFAQWVLAAPGGAALDRRRRRRRTGLASRPPDGCGYGTALMRTGKISAWSRCFRTRNDEEPGRNPCDVGAHDNRDQRKTTHGDARPGIDQIGRAHV